MRRRSRDRLRWLVRAVRHYILGATLCLGAAGGCANDSAEFVTASLSAKLGPLAVEGAVSCDFELPADMDPKEVGPIIERDRMYMAARSGFHRKHIPFRFDPLRGRMQTGGRYLFESHVSAKHYLTWLEDDYLLDGVLFFERPYFLDPRCYVWRVLGAEYFREVDSHHYIRTERFRAPATFDKYPEMRRHWGSMRDEAASRNLAAISFSYNSRERLVEIVHIASLETFETAMLNEAATLGTTLLSEGFEAEFDQTRFVLTIWSSFQPGDHGAPSPWPNSPPLPLPYCGDSVCEVSRGEEGHSCPVDCPPNCGDTMCQSEEGEDTANCPGDCRI